MEKTMEDLGNMVVVDDPLKEQSFVVIDDLEDDDSNDAKPMEATGGDTIVCEHCNVVLHGQSQWEEHKKSKNHIKKEEMKSTFIMDEKDMLVDVTTLTYKAVQNSKTMFIGADAIVTDRATDEIKCTICKVLLKDSPSILIHLRSAKHVHVFFKSRFPEMYKEVQKKAKNRAEIQSMVARYADEFVRKFGGKKEPRVFQKGYYDSLSADRRSQVDEMVERRQVEMMDMMMYRHRSPSRERERSRSYRRSPSFSIPRGREPARRPRSRSPASIHNRDRFTEPHRSYSRDRERAYSRDRDRDLRDRDARDMRDRDRDRERYYSSRGHSRDRERERSFDRERERDYRDRDYRDMYGSPRKHLPEHYPRPRSRSPMERRYDYQEYPPRPAPGMTENWRDSDYRIPPGPGRPRSDTLPSRSPEPAPIQAPAAPVGQSLSKMRSEMAEVDVDKLDELPTEFEIFDTLCNAEMVEIEKGERAYIQDFIDAIEDHVTGVDYIAEYSDWKAQYEPGYLCTLCECRLNPAQAVKHIVNDKHTMNYMKRHYPKKFTALCIGTLGEEVRRQMKNKYIQEIATNEPKRLITQKIMLPPESRQVFRRHKQISSAQSIWKEPAKEPAIPPVALSPPVKNEPAPISKPTMIFSEKAVKAKELSELEKTLPPYCEKNLEEGWYSVRSKTIEYYEKVALAKNPKALYFSVRDPHGKEEFYGEWNPSLMRRLQDKFNFRLEHIRWLQKLLSDWKVPMYTPLQMADLRPLEQEVESAVLNELIDMILKPVSTLRYMQTFEYENYDAEIQEAENRKRKEEEDRKQEELERKRRLEQEQRLKEEAEKNKEEAEKKKREEAHRRISEAQQEMKRAQRLKAGLAVEKRIAEVNMDAESGPEIKVRRVIEDRDERVKPSETKTDKSEERPAAAPQPPPKVESEKEKKLRVLIESVLRVAKQQGQQHKNAILQMVVNFPNAPEILFRLATRQPAQLQQLVTVAKNPMLTIPPGILEQLHKKLKEVEAEAEEERIAEEKLIKIREEAAKKREEEEEKKKQEESRRRVEEARAELLKSRKDEEQRKAALDMVSNRKPVQILTPKLPEESQAPQSTGAQQIMPGMSAATNQSAMMSTAMSQPPPFGPGYAMPMPGQGQGLFPAYGGNIPSQMYGAPRMTPAVMPFWALPRGAPPQQNPRYSYYN